MSVYVDLTTQQKRGTAFASSEVEVVGKPDNKKLGHSPTPCVEAALPSRCYQPCMKISQVSTSQVWSITLLLPSGSFPLRLQNYNLFLKRTRKKPENLQKVYGCENDGGKKHLNEVN